MATAKGHLQQQQKNFQPTKKQLTIEEINEEIIDATVELEEGVTRKIYFKENSPIDQAGDINTYLYCMAMMRTASR
eukprot:6772502-Ditylum_brightwellii.AAC.1